MYSARIGGQALGGPISWSRRVWAPLGGIRRAWAPEIFLSYLTIWDLGSNSKPGKKKKLSGLGISHSPSLLEFPSDLIASAAFRPLETTPPPSKRLGSNPQSASAVDLNYFVASQSHLSSGLLHFYTVWALAK